MSRTDIPIPLDKKKIGVSFDAYTIKEMNKLLEANWFDSPSALVRAAVQDFVKRLEGEVRSGGEDLERQPGNLKIRSRVIVPQKNLAKLFLQAKTPLNALHHYFCFALLQINFTIRSLFQFLQVGWRERLTFGNPVRG